MHFDHTDPPSSHSHPLHHHLPTHPVLNSSFLLSSLVCVAQLLLGVEPALVCGLPTRAYIIL